MTEFNISVHSVTVLHIADHIKKNQGWQWDTLEAGCRLLTQPLVIYLFFATSFDWMNLSLDYERKPSERSHLGP